MRGWLLTPPSPRQFGDDDGLLKSWLVKVRRAKAALASATPDHVSATGRAPVSIELSAVVSRQGLPQCSSTNAPAPRPCADVVDDPYPGSDVSALADPSGACPCLLLTLPLLFSTT